MKRVTEGNDVGCSFGGEYTRHASGVLDVETVVATFDVGQLDVRDDQAVRPGLAKSTRLARDVDHPKFASPVGVAKRATHSRLAAGDTSRPAVRRRTPAPPHRVPHTH